MRVTPNGVQLRERTPSTPACLDADHFAQTCENCWTVQALTSASQWHPVSERVQVRIDSNDSDTTCRVEIRRRMNANNTQPEVIWSEPWTVPRYSTTELYKAHRDNRDIDTTWVDITPDVQISEGHTFPHGILVRRATGCEDLPWTTPTFLPETHWRWSNLLPDGSLQFRCWRTREEENGWGNYRIEVRQRVGRKPVLAVEPVWSGSKSGNHAARSNGYTLELLREPRGYSYHRSVTGVRVIDSNGRPCNILTTNRWVLAAPDLLVNASSQGSFCWKNATSEVKTTLWSMPEERLLRRREWTLLSDTVRAKLARGRRGVRVETLRSSPVRRHRWSRQSWWLPCGTKSFGTMHHLTDTIRVTFRPDQMAEIQCVAPVILDQ
jgi:hypothetical protein